MSPQEYFPSIYRNDLRVFSEWKSLTIPDYGPFDQLCGWTVGALFEPTQRIKYASPSDFICCLYALNLLNQSLYSMHSDYYYEWCAKSEPFIDSRGCKSGHGGFTSAPNSILRFARDPSYVPRATPVEISNDQIQSYIRYFFNEYLNQKILSESFRKEDFVKFIEMLESDPDCDKLKRYI